MKSTATTSDKVMGKSSKGSSQKCMQYVKLCGRNKDGTEKCVYLSRLVMGTDHLGTQWVQESFPEKEKFKGKDGKIDQTLVNNHARKMFESAVSAGINMFDTSPIYEGGIEYTLGNWIHGKGGPNNNNDRSDDLYVLSKGGFPYDIGPGEYRSRFRVEEGNSSRIGNHEEVVANLAEEMYWSHKNLHGVILFWIMHRDDIRYENYQKIEDFTQDGKIDEHDKQITALKILEAISDNEERTIEVITSEGERKDLLAGVESRKLRDHYQWTGVSNWSSKRVEEILEAADSHPNLAQPMINSPYFSLFEMDEKFTIHSGGVQVKHAEMMNKNFQKDILIMPYSPLGGFPIFDSLIRLEGKEEITEGDVWEKARQEAAKLDIVKDRYWGNAYEAIFTDANKGRFERVYAASTYFTLNGKDFTVDQWVNAWVLAHPRTDLLAIGPIEAVDSTHL